MKADALGTLVSLALFASVVAASEAPVLPVFLSDHGVLQRDRPIPILGQAAVGAQVSVRFADQSGTAVADAQGRWSVLLTAMPAGGPYVLEAAVGEARTTVSDLMLGDLWLCSGQSNIGVGMNRIVDAPVHLKELDGKSIRWFRQRYRVADEPRSGFDAAQPGWTTCTAESAATFSAIALAFAHRLLADEQVTIGLIHANKAGSFIEGWIPPGFMAGNPTYDPIRTRWAWLEAHRSELQQRWTTEHAAWKQEHQARFDLWKKAPTGGPFQPHEPAAPPNVDSPLRPGVLWNGMIAPFTAWPIRGVLWYQGESNSDRAWQYRVLLQDLILSWRAAWQDESLPVVIAQLPDYETDTCPYDYQDGGSWEIVRESQSVAARLPKVGLAVGLGLGGHSDIHPPDKWPFGHRLARVALAIAYGRNLAWSGPRLGAMDRDGARCLLRFVDMGDGLKTLDGSPVIGFEIAGADRRFVPARGEIVGADTVVVSAAGIDEPVAVRYAWDDDPRFSLTDDEGLPAAPFRTDDWPVPTQEAVAPFHRTWPVVSIAP